MAKVQRAHKIRLNRTKQRLTKKGGLPGCDSLVNQKTVTKMNSIFMIQGGAGDVLAQTPMLRAARQKHPDDNIIVISPYTQVLKNNPNIDEVISLSEIGDIYDEFVVGKDVRFFKKHFLYDSIRDDPAVNCKTLLEFACNVYGFEYDGNPPDYFISDQEKRMVDTFMSQTKKRKVLLHIFGAVPSDGNYGIMLCGFCGGNGVKKDGDRCESCNGSGKIVSRQKTNNLKDLNPDTVAYIVDKHKDKFDFLQIGLEAEPLIPGAFDCLGMPMRDSIALISKCSTFIFIESLFAHAAGALKKSGVVVFQNTSPDFFGYPTAFNVWDSGGCPQWPCNRPVGALCDFLAGYRNPKTREKLLWECPDQKCARINPEQLEKVFLESVEKQEIIE